MNLLADPLPYVEKAANVSTSEGGTDLEDDLSLAERTYLAPSGFSTAGPQDAYTYWTKTRNTDVGSVRPVSNQAAGTVTVYVLMRDGTLPGAEVLADLTEFLKNREIRPMTDLVTVSAPTVKSFSITLTYYIARSNQASAAAIQGRVDAAIADFITWQTTEIGRDINQTELIRRVREAGAKRVAVTAPEFTTVAATEVAQLAKNGMAVTYGGLEDD